MGFLYWWSRFRDDLHAPKETDYDLAKRLAHTPPEYWRREDHSLARRLHHRWRELYQSYIERGYSTVYARFLANEALPEGPYWPQTPQRDNAYKRERDQDRMWHAIEQALEMEGDPDRVLYLSGDDGEMFAFNPDNGQSISLAQFGM